MKTLILLKSHLVELPAASSPRASTAILGTLTANLLHYGYLLSKDAYVRFTKSSDAALKDWWSTVEPVLRAVTGDDRNMDRFVVYKNFPKEVLDMSQAQYWVSQILMYWGLPNELFTAEEKPRDKLLEKTSLKVLQAADAKSLRDVFNGLLKSPARWTKEQTSFAIYLQSQGLSWDVKDISFKENMALFVAALSDAGVSVKLSSATDVLRLAIGLSEGDVSMRTNTKLRHFKRGQRRFFLGLLDKASNLAEDMARDVERWKRFIALLHPADYPRFKNVTRAAAKLYDDKVVSFNAGIENALKDDDAAVLKTLSKRPGEFMRRFHHTYKIFGRKAVDAFADVLSDLTTAQLLKVERYVDTVNDREHRTIAPQGNWSKLQILPNDKVKLKAGHREILTERIATLLATRTKAKVGSVNLQDSAAGVKLQTNDADLSPFGRGTVFPIPDNINFLRSASYWRCKRGHSVWFDNGWNFFDADWKSVDTLCWNSTDMGGAAVFSGDPTNSKEMEGRACQMIDLYIDKLAARGIRYGVWNILCFSHIKFSEAEEMFASLQWGEHAQKGKLFEPSRSQFTAPIQGDSFTKYILYLDIEERKIVYMDANLRGSTSSAASNTATLEKQMPAFVEYLNTLPSVHDLFRHTRQSKKGTVITYDDADIKVDGRGYVFKPVNKDNTYRQLNLSEVLA